MNTPPLYPGLAPTGLEQLLDDPAWLGTSGKLGLLTHPAGVTRTLVPSAVALLQRGFALERLYGPEHGIDGSGQAGEAPEVLTDRATGLPTHSLYEKGVAEIAELIAQVDTLLVDLQDAGVRFYTFVSTLVQVLEAARISGTRVVVLDRPNPLGFTLEGPVLQPAFRSFVGMLEVPLRHGLTLGECGRLVEPGLEVIPCDPQANFGSGGLPWVPPSPNLPNPQTVLLYVGMALIEASTASEGRGTALPFQVAGAPGLDAEALAQRLGGLGLAGVRFRPHYFRPTFSKHQGQLCAGVQVHVLELEKALPVGLAVLGALAEQGVEIRHDWLQKLLGIPFEPSLLEPEKALEHARAWAERAHLFAQEHLRPIWLYPRSSL
ncbi:MAG: hypothetical protein KatS3mg074_070 [Meiothermus sp.]|uniref:DUF1343 domain-containing protein n=2 Tax=Meiothermus hypogaeus TaxID=884155 RepID=A0A511R1Q8_9DEIN|nr:DUF1343 domain-containing protein [Meiothermus hypogaeus]RIH80160.1 hypothetical protein Mhypo_00784 [Meiothermus hypogaeus]GEM83543.1 hypothetical protein MHY01S_17090 [Meiothermus hypogaeus NBRC 106114]GIW37672.1 MAG: hypothetical protein KatS3mg074_070 [Meiothermus sp.]